MACIEDAGFKFTDQKEYEKVSKYVLSYVKLILLKELNLQCYWVPKKGRILKNVNYGKKEDYPQADIYVSPDFTTNKDKLLILIQGTGSVRAGYILNLILESGLGQFALIQA
jgi:hypothetical protein